MKFGKEFAAQTVPEWQAAYMDYTSLKNLLKEINRLKGKNRQPDTPTRLQRALTLYRSFSGLIQRQNQRASSFEDCDVENQAILVNSVQAGNGSGKYETTFLLVAEAETLTKQMDAFIAFHIKAEKVEVKFDVSASSDSKYFLHVIQKYIIFEFVTA